MHEAILALQIAVRDAERTVASHWDEVQKLKEEISLLDGYHAAAYERYLAAEEWLFGLRNGLEALEKINARA